MAKSVGVDVGGTFTDFIFFDEETRAAQVIKVPSTPQDQSLGLLRGLEASDSPLSDLAMIVHGTTVATNAVLERKGSRCGLITTRGFRDVLELRRRDRPTIYGMKGSFEPLIPREMRLEIEERVDADGQLLISVKDDEVANRAKELLALGAEAVVVSFLHSYANPVNERVARDVLRRVWPNEYIVVASDILPEFREFERTSTAVVSAYVQPLIGRYLSSLVERLKGQGYRRDVLLIQSNGGVMSLDVSKRFAVNTLLSGPAAGVIAAASIAKAAGFPDAVSCDMGGTSFDVCLIVGGRASTTTESQIGYGIPLRVPMIDIVTIGAGGGSIAFIDRAGILQVGPESAGAEPGPVCYGKGGMRPTVTDADLILGRINPDYPIGHRKGFVFDVARAREQIQSVIAAPLSYGTEEAAHAILTVANTKMAGAIRKVSVERGYDPRQFALVPFGGAGPLHAYALMREVGIRHAVVPYYPGITSAIGCIMADVRHDFVQTVNVRLGELDMAQIHGVLSGQIEQGYELVREEGVVVEGMEAFCEADMSYVGQTHTVRVQLPSPMLTKEELMEVFGKGYARLYGSVLENAPIKVMSVRSTVIGRRPRLDWTRFYRAIGTLAESRKGVRQVYFEGRFIETPIYERSRLPLGAELEGPAVIEQADATTLVDPGVALRVDSMGNLILEVV